VAELHPKTTETVIAGVEGSLEPPRMTDCDPEQVTPLGEIIGQALEHRDPHVLKFTEGCAREYALRPDPTYLQAAQTLIKQTPAW
jgi:hypothetical protein